MIFVKRKGISINVYRNAFPNSVLKTSSNIKQIIFDNIFYHKISEIFTKKLIISKNIINCAKKRCIFLKNML